MSGCFRSYVPFVDEYTPLSESSRLCHTDTYRVVLSRKLSTTIALDRKPFLMVKKNGYFLPSSNEIPIFLNLPLDFGLKLFLFKYHG